MENKNRTREAIRVSILTIIANVVLALAKFIAGTIGHSAAMIADAVHSFSDVASTIVVIFAVRISGKAPDDTHPYGHDRFESLSAVLLSVMLILAGGGIGLNSIRALVSHTYLENRVIGWLPIAAAAMSVMVKEAMYHFTVRAGKRLRSESLIADAWHHRSDALSSIGSLIGIGGAMLGVPILDQLTSLVICVFILKTAYEIFISASEKLTDHSCDIELEKKIQNTILATPGVCGIDSLKTRQSGVGIYVDVEISADPKQTLEEAHAIAEAVHDRIETIFTDVKHCMVHVNPSAK